MIGATTKGGNAFTARLAQRARRVAAAWVETRHLVRARNPLRWRRASLLWPNFTGEP